MSIILSALESGLYLALDEVHVAWCLIKLLEYGLVCLVTVASSPA